MSNTTTKTAPTPEPENTAPATPYIPGDEDVPTPTSGKTVWRFAEGEIRTGREGEVRTREKIVGRLDRIGIYFGTSKSDGEYYGQLEADIETRDEGMVRIKAGITEKGTGALKPSVAALSFAEGLLDCAKDEIIIVTANLASKPNRFGKFSTYANLHRYDPATKKTSPTKRRPKSDASIDDKWDALAKELGDHPAFADRPASDTDDEQGNATTHLSDLCKTCAAKGWPSPEQAPSEWLTLAAGAYKHARRSTIRDYSDDEWGQIHMVVQKLEQMPAALEPAARRLQPAAPAGGLDLGAFGGGDYDAHADTD